MEKYIFLIQLYDLSLNYIKKYIIQKKIMYFDKERVKEGLLEISRIEPVLLKYLKEILDDYHQQNQTLRYYDIIAGSWLLHYIHTMYAASKINDFE